MKQPLCAFLFLCIILSAKVKSQNAPQNSGVNKNYNFQSFLYNTNTLLDEYIVRGRVNYNGLKENKEEISRIVEQIAKMNLTGFTREDKNAFFVNAYNVLVIYSIMKDYPEKSSSDSIKGFFGRQYHTVAGGELTLNVLEEDSIVKNNSDNPALYFSLYKGGLHPIAPNFAYYPYQFRERVEYRIKKFVNNSAFIEISEQYKTIYLSPIFKWHQIGVYADVRKFINSYRNKKLPEAYAIDYSDVEWEIEPFQQFLLSTEAHSIVSISPSSLKYIMDKSSKRVQILDTRTEREFKISHIKGARQIDFLAFRMRNVWMLKRDQLVIVCSNRGDRSNLIGQYLLENGFTNVKNLSLVDWVNAGYELVDEEDKKTTKIQ